MIDEDARKVDELLRAVGQMFQGDEAADFIRALNGGRDAMQSLVEEARTYSIYFWWPQFTPHWPTCDPDWWQHPAF